MSREDQIIDYTLGDRLLLAQLDGKLDTICRKLDEGTPQVIAHEERIKVLETSRKRVVAASWAAAVSLFIYGLKELIKHLASTG